MYSWHSNKGYGTAEHRAAIDVYGICRYHRKSFNIYSLPANPVFDEEALAELQ
jgi:ribonuclease HII